MSRPSLVLGNNLARRSGRFLATTLLAVALLASLTVDWAWAVQITITSVQGFPNGRTSDDPPANAVDGDINTFTWTTASGNLENPSHLAIGFASTSVNRIRLWKDNASGYGFSPNIKDLTIQYTADTAVPLSSRTWVTVTGLTNGFLGTELLNATAVNSNGTVTGDVHNSAAGDGWAALTFDTVDATGLRISFSVPGGSGVNHYRVGEFEAHFSPRFPFATFAPSVKILLGPGINDDTFDMTATFTLGTGSDGIGPLAEDVRLQIGVFSARIPAGSFRLDRLGRFSFDGVIGGVTLKVLITPLDGGGQNFKLNAKGLGANLAGAALPLDVGLTIGNDGNMVSLADIAAK